MGKYLIEYMLPALILVSGVLSLVRWWYVKHFASRIKNWKEIRTASKKYEAELAEDNESLQDDFYNDIFRDTEGRN